MIPFKFQQTHAGALKMWALSGLHQTPKGAQTKDSPTTLRMLIRKWTRTRRITGALGEGNLIQDVRVDWRKAPLYRKQACTWTWEGCL